MVRWVILLASMLLVSVDADAGTRRRAAAAAHPSNLTWTIEIMTSGGFTGHGVGSVIINAGGSITAVDLAKTCSSRLSEREIAALDDLIQKAKPDEWNFCYVRAGNPTGCCDMVQYRFTLKDLDAQHREHLYSTYWYNGTSPPRPADLDELFEAAWQLRRQTLENCP